MDELDSAIVERLQAFLHAFLMDKFSKRREIVSFRSAVIYQHTRNPVIVPLDA